jgi:hypothetical protein
MVQLVTVSPIYNYWEGALDMAYSGDPSAIIAKFIAPNFNNLGQGKYTSNVASTSFHSDS